MAVKIHEQKSLAKQQLVEFLIYTEANSDAVYKFVCAGSISNARNFIHRMRVELSRMRDQVRSLNRRPRRFMMRVIDIIVDEGHPVAQCFVTLQRIKDDEAGRDIELLMTEHRINDDVKLPDESISKKQENREPPSSTFHFFRKS